MTHVDMTTHPMWEDKAIAFLARSRTELWGKHNEDIMAWLFLKGFKNKFIKDILIGWNSRPKERPSDHWGYGPDFSDGHARPGHVYLPSGVVIPFFIGPKLKKMTIVDWNNPPKHPPYRIPGSSPDPMIYPGKPDSILISWDILHGLFALQELGDLFSVIIFDPDSPVDDTLDLDWVKQASRVVLITGGSREVPETHMAAMRMRWPDMSVIEPGMIGGFAETVRPLGKSCKAYDTNGLKS